MHPTKSQFLYVFYFTRKQTTNAKYVLLGNRLSTFYLTDITPKIPFRARSLQNLTFYLSIILLNSLSPDRTKQVYNNIIVQFLKCCSCRHNNLHCTDMCLCGGTEDLCNNINETIVDDSDEADDEVEDDSLKI